MKLRKIRKIMPGLRHSKVFTSKGESCANIGYFGAPQTVDEGWTVRYSLAVDIVSIMRSVHASKSAGVCRFRVS